MRDKTFLESHLHFSYLLKRNQLLKSGFLKLIQSIVTLEIIVCASS